MGEPLEDGTFADDVGWAEDSGAWRFGRYRALGFREWDAVILAHDKTVDWHTVKRALDGGCTHDQALRIFT